MKTYLLVAAALLSIPSVAICDRSRPSVVYDKADWHSGGEYPKGVPIENASNHIGMFLAWLVDRNLIDGEFEKDNDSIT